MSMHLFFCYRLRSEIRNFDPLTVREAYGESRQRLSKEPIFRFSLQGLSNNPYAIEWSEQEIEEFSSHLRLKIDGVQLESALL